MLLFQRQFGPGGISPPTCGAPRSGYVCCRVGHNDQFDTVFLPAPQHGSRPPPPPPAQRPNGLLQASPSNINQVGGILNGNGGPGRDQRFTGLGQCGRRNAHGITGRVATSDFAPNEGDTEFGKCPPRIDTPSVSTTSSLMSATCTLLITSLHPPHQLFSSFPKF